MLFGMLYFGFGFEFICIINLIYLFLVIQYIPFKVGTVFAFTSPIFVNYWGTVGLVAANGVVMPLRSIYSIHYASTYFSKWDNTKSDLKKTQPSNIRYSLSIDETICATSYCVDEFFCDLPNHLCIQKKIAIRYSGRWRLHERMDKYVDHGSFSTCQYWHRLCFGDTRSSSKV